MYLVQLVSQTMSHLLTCQLQQQQYKELEKSNSQLVDRVARLETAVLGISNTGGNPGHSTGYNGFPLLGSSSSSSLITDSLGSRYDDYPRFLLVTPVNNDYI